MNIAYTTASGTGTLDHLLHGVALRLISMGMRPCGIVQFNTERGQGARCDMDVLVLPDGPVLRISQHLGPGARGCRLAPASLEEAAGRVLAALAAGSDVLIVNKFGKHEADGRGFRPVIAAALERDIPVLVGVSQSGLPAFLDFAGELAVALPPDQQALLDWFALCRTGRAIRTS